MFRILTYVKDIRDAKRSSKETLESLQTLLKTHENYFSKVCGKKISIESLALFQ